MEAGGTARRTSQLQPDAHRPPPARGPFFKDDLGRRPWLVQGLRICLPGQGTQFDPWSGKISHEQGN